jgi:hypothetical protein
MNWKTRPGEIWALNSAFDWLREKGIKIDRGICIGPENEILNYFQTAGQGDKFLFGYHTHPDLVDRALNRRRGQPSGIWPAPKNGICPCRSRRWFTGRER